MGRRRLNFVDLVSLLLLLDFRLSFWYLQPLRGLDASFVFALHRIWPLAAALALNELLALLLPLFALVAVQICCRIVSEASIVDIL